MPTYTPKVVDVDKSGNTIVLTVGYLGGDQWAQDAEGNMVAPEPDKYMKVTLRERDGAYYISALQSTLPPETATTAATSAPAETETQTETQTAPADTTAPATQAAGTTAAAAQ